MSISRVQAGDVVTTEDKEYTPVSKIGGFWFLTAVAAVALLWLLLLNTPGADLMMLGLAIVTMLAAQSERWFGGGIGWRYLAACLIAFLAVAPASFEWILLDSKVNVQGASSVLFSGMIFAIMMGQGIVSSGKESFISTLEALAVIGVVFMATSLITPNDLIDSSVLSREQLIVYVGLLPAVLLGGWLLSQKFQRSRWLIASIGMGLLLPALILWGPAMSSVDNGLAFVGWVTVQIVAVFSGGRYVREGDEGGLSSAPGRGE